MSPHVSITVIALKTLTLLLGGLITFLAYRAYRRTHSQSLGALALGFAIVTLGALLAGISDLIVELPIQQTLLLESTLTAGGFAVIVYSLYTGD
ncbi:DUF7521 family protein [Halorhabdus amylolytica]|uniref:DUF7521 family protein n=1 Tax=Halorhabdus amylolytica TaxID=2559573 RepID=UPI0010A9ACDD|nr:hypothetical protein [Halorhabdus amylolytica]